MSRLFTFKDTNTDIWHIQLRHVFNYKWHEGFYAAEIEVSRNMKPEIFTSKLFLVCDWLIEKSKLTVNVKSYPFLKT